VVTYRSNIRGEYEICLPFGCDYVLEGSKLGYDSGTTSVSTVRLRGSRSLNADLLIHPTSDAILREPIKEGTVILLENIYYDFNKSAIRKGAAQDLEALAQLMNSYPSMQIELGAHTDSRGTPEYNLDLSLRRADSAKEFLLQRGVAESRIRAVGYGETQPRNHCIDDVECDEKEHRLNRRTEVKVLNIDERVKISYEGENSN
jgi:outer membrane protein OmpA-like peptidoglycan-associated protein